MNKERLHSLYQNTTLADKTDIEDVKQLTEDYPYYALPYLILSKYYYETRHYRFDEMLRQAAMRVKDRKALYNYIHSTQQTIQAHVMEQVVTEEAIIHEQEPEPVHTELVSLEDFLGTDITEQPAEPIDFSDVAESIEAPIEVKSEEVPVVEAFNTAETIKDDHSEAIADEEFTIDTHAASPKIDTIEIDYDIIGEEIETEFSFSKSFASKRSSDEDENINIADNTSASLNEEIAEPVPSDTLRKYPVYSIDNYFKDQVEAPKKEEKEEAPSPERDFFAWLKAPKGMAETEQKSESSQLKK